MGKKYKYDVFISHAVEDKLPIANDLCARLEKAGLKVWYSGSELNAGDSITRTVREGLDKSRFGIVILSKNYIAKNWPLREFYHLLARESDGVKVILPVLHNITPAELAVEDLTMADLFAINADKGIDQVVTQLIEAMKKTKPPKPDPRKRWQVVGAAVSLAAASYLAVPFLLSNPTEVKPEKEPIDRAIQRRVETISEKVASGEVHDFMASGAIPSSLQKLDSLYLAYQHQKSHYRNEYEFSDGTQTVRARKNVEAVLGENVATLNPANAYRLKQPICYLVKTEKGVRYALQNAQPVSVSRGGEKLLNDSTYSVTAFYENNIRYIEVELIFNTSPSGVKRHRARLFGLLPQETLLFKKRHGRWVLTSPQ
jgi:hypothetical protein